MRRTAVAITGSGACAFMATMWLPWFQEEFSGGLDGKGAGMTPRSVSGWDALPVTSVLLVGAAAATVALAVVGARQARYFGLAPAVTLGALTVFSLGIRDPGCCDQILATTTPRAGLGAALLATVLVAVGGWLATGGHHRRLSETPGSHSESGTL